MTPIVRAYLFYSAGLNFNLEVLSHSINIKVKEKEKETLDKMQNAKIKVRNEIRELKDRLKLAQENMQFLKECIETDELVSEDAV